MRFPKFRRRDYEEDYASYDDYDNGYDDNYDDGYDNVEDINEAVVEEDYSGANNTGPAGKAFEMKIITPKTYEDREEIARCLVMGNAVFLNIENLSRENVIRFMDYLGGVIYVIDGKVKWSNSSSVIFAPKNVNISGIDDVEETTEEVDEIIEDDYN